MPFETSPEPEHDPELDDTGSFNKAEVLRGVAKERIAQAKSFEALNIALRDLGNVSTEGTLQESGYDLQARITDLRDKIGEAQLPEDIGEIENEVEEDLMKITHKLGLREKVRELIMPELNKKRAEIAGKEKE